MSVVDTVKSTASGPGRKWIVIGAIGGLGYLWYTRVRSSAGASSSAEGGAQITPGGAAVADPITPAGGDYSEPTGPRQRPQNNGEWVSEAMAQMILPPYNRPTAATYNALLKALDGQPITTAEASIVELAIQLQGTPPEGMPPLNISSPASPTTTDPTPAPPPPAPNTSTGTTHTVRSGDTLSGIASGWGVATSSAYNRNAGVIEAAAKAHGKSSSRGGPNNSLGWWIFPGTVLTKP